TAALRARRPEPDANPPRPIPAYFQGRPERECSDTEHRSLICHLKGGSSCPTLHLCPLSLCAPPCSARWPAISSRASTAARGPTAPARLHATAASSASS